jgi:hypothetical protein
MRKPKELSARRVARILHDLGVELLDGSLVLKGFETRGSADIPGAVQLLIRVKGRRPSDVTIWLQRREWV